jgi:hypothetical protein
MAVICAIYMWGFCPLLLADEVRKLNKTEQRGFFVL